MDLSKETLVKWYRQMLTIRYFEEAVMDLYRLALMPGLSHLYIGQEAVAVGACAALRPEDWITSTHRGHGHVLAKGLDPKALVAELCGKAAGCSGGRGGSMHLYEPEIGLYGTNGLVAAGIPVGVGLGLSAKKRGKGEVAVVFFGDGASNHGAFHEGMNFAGIQQLPIVFVCENNLYATDTPLHLVTRNTEIASKAASYGIEGVPVDGNDVFAVYDAAKKAVEKA